MTHRNRKLLDAYHEAPCFLNLAPTCGNHPSVPCHSDQLRHDRGVGHKSHDCLSVSGCPDCHELFTRKHLGDRYDEVWQRAHEKSTVWLWESGKVKVA